MSVNRERQTRIYLTQSQRDKIEDLCAASGLPYSRMIGVLLEYALEHVEWRERVVYDVCFDGERRPGETIARYTAETRPISFVGKRKSTTGVAALVVDTEGRED